MNTDAEKLIGIMAKCYAARRGAKSLLGDKFATEMAEFQGYIRQRMARDKSTDLSATMSLLAELQAKAPDSGVTQMYVLAAFVEMVEPSTSHPCPSV